MLILLPLILLGQNTSNNCIDNKYPVTRIIDGDTVVLFSQAQELCIYERLETLEAIQLELAFSNNMQDFAEEYIDSLNSRIKLYQLETSVLDKTLDLKNKKIEELKNDILLSNSIINVVEKEKNYYKEESTKFKKQRNTAYGVTGGIILATIITFVATK